MAKQIGPIKFTGTIDELVFYKMDGKYYVRKKSSLSGKRVKKDPVFKKTMDNANLFGKASPIASQRYHRLPIKEKTVEVYREIMSKVTKELRKKEGLA